jgi:hypothetical protein
VLRIAEDVGAESFPPLERGSTEGALSDVDERIGPRDISIAFTEQPITRFAQRSIDDRPVVGLEEAVYPPGPVLVLHARKVLARRRDRLVRPELLWLLALFDAFAIGSRSGRRPNGEAQLRQRHHLRPLGDVSVVLGLRPYRKARLIDGQLTGPECLGDPRMCVGRFRELEEGAGMARRQAGAPRDPLLDRTNAETVPGFGGDRLADQADQRRVAGVEVSARRGDAVVQRSCRSGRLGLRRRDHPAHS